MHTRRASFEVHTYEVDAFHVLALPALAGYMQDLAGVHAAEMGCGIDELKGRGLTWVLSRQRIEVRHAARLGDALEVETWPSGVDRVFALREFRARLGDGSLVAKASTHWAVMDLARRRPVRPDRVLAAEYHAAQERTLPPAEDLPTLGAADDERRFRIRYADIDQNMHVTNTSYLGWALEAVPQEVWRDCSVAWVDVHFLAECTYGSRIASCIRARAALDFLHSIVREEDGKELARVATRWEPRGETGG